MMKKKQTGKGNGLSAGLEGGTTLIARNTRLKGDVFFEDQLYVNGSIEGDVSAQSSDTATLVVCEGGVVKGEIRAPNVVIDGTVEGDVYATGKLELAAKAKVLGHVGHREEKRTSEPRACVQNAGCCVRPQTSAPGEVVGSVDFVGI